MQPLKARFDLRKAWIQKMITACMTLNLILPAQSFALATPAEKTSEQIVRTAASGLLLSTTLSKNIMRQVPYEDDYTVEVPYQAEETYYESVPYEDQEAYTDYETYYETEYRCRTVDDSRRECRNEQVCSDVGGGRQCTTENECRMEGGGRECRTEGGGQQCRTENECRDSGGGRQCSNQQVCRDVGGGQTCQNVEECGTSATGQRICKTRQQCTNNPSRRECHNEQKCYDVPGSRVCTPRQVCENRPGRQVCEDRPGRQVCTPRQKCYDVPGRRECRSEQRCETVPRTRQECSNEQVAKTRAVTKYRTVTKYRQEARTRTVTKYRTETRCCVTRYREEFDRQQSLNVEVIFPAGSELLANEKELVLLQLQGDEAEPSASLTVKESIFGYRIVDQKRVGGIYRIQLGLVAKYSPAQVGAESIQDLTLVIEGTQGAVSFRDLGQKARVTSRHQIQIITRAGAVVAEAQRILTTPQEQIEIAIPTALDEEEEYQIRLVTERTGLVLESPVQFEKRADYTAEQIENATVYMDPNQLTNWDLLGVGASVGLYFKDRTPDHPLVKTSYKILLQINGQTLGSATLDRVGVRKNADGLMQILLAQDMKIPIDVLRQKVTRSAQIQVSVETVRQSPKLNRGKPVVLKKSFIDKSRD